MGRYLCIAALGAMGLVQSSPVDEDDRAYLLAHLEMTRQFVIDATKGLTREQWLHSSGTSRWSIAQCVDHLARTEEYVLQMVRDRVIKSDKPIEPFPSQTPGTPISVQATKRPKAADALLIRAMTDRIAAVRTPVESRPPVEEVAPRTQIDDPQTALDAFLKARAALISYAQSTQDDLRGHFTYTRLAGYYPEFAFHDGYQWLLRMSAHTERHLMQVQEVKASSGYPRPRADH